jgi:chromatin remodeling complex protein RSC6
MPKRKKRRKTKKRKTSAAAGNNSRLANLALRCSEELGALLGVQACSRGEAVKQLWRYAREHGLNEGRSINCDTAMRRIFRVDSMGMFEVAKLLAPHLTALPAGAETDAAATARARARRASSSTLEGRPSQRPRTAVPVSAAMQPAPMAAMAAAATRRLQEMKGPVVLSGLLTAVVCGGVLGGKGSGWSLRRRLTLPSVGAVSARLHAYIASQRLRIPRSNTIQLDVALAELAGAAALRGRRTLSMDEIKPLLLAPHLSPLPASQIPRVVSGAHWSPELLLASELASDCGSTPPEETLPTVPTPCASAAAAHEPAPEAAADTAAPRSATAATITSSSSPPPSLSSPSSSSSSPPSELSALPAGPTLTQVERGAPTTGWGSTRHRRLSAADDEDEEEEGEGAGAGGGMAMCTQLHTAAEAAGGGYYQGSGSGSGSGWRSGGGGSEAPPPRQQGGRGRASNAAYELEFEEGGDDDASSSTEGSDSDTAAAAAAAAAQSDRPPPAALNAAACSYLKAEVKAEVKVEAKAEVKVEAKAEARAHGRGAAGQQQPAAAAAAGWVVREWLGRGGLGEHVEAFARERVETIAALRRLSEADLRELGLALGHRRLFQHLLEEDQAAAAAAAAAASVV